MNVTENYLFQQMQTVAAMTGVPQTGGKEKTSDGSSFQDMMDQAGSRTNSDDKVFTRETKDIKNPLKKKMEDPEQVPVEDEEELQPEQLAANPNAVSVLDLFRPDVALPKEEPLIEVPVDAVAGENAAGPDLELDGQMPEMESGVEDDVDPGMFEGQRRKFSRDDIKDIIKDIPQEEVEAASRPSLRNATISLHRAESAGKEELPEVEVRAGGEIEDEPEVEMADTQQFVFHEVKSTPVKVGETYETVDTQKPDAAQKLADVIQTAAQNGQQRVEIHLAPQNLGSLVIEMTKDANGALQVVLHASNAKAAGVLNQHMDGLQAALRSYSQEEVRIEVQHSEESQQQHFKQADPDGRGQQNRQQQEHREEKHSGDAFIQKLRLGLFDTDEI